jgi:hypothetical protein
LRAIDRQFGWKQHCDLMDSESMTNRQKLIQNFLKIVGAITIAVGLVAAYYGPLEVYVFYMFSPGGRFHYDGFAVGTLWFAYLVLQNLGYYLVAALLLPIGIGTFKLRRWAYTLTRALLWLWVGAGLLFSLNWTVLAYYQWHTNPSDPTIYVRIVVFSFIFCIFSLVIPILLLWFYSRKTVRCSFENFDHHQYWTERYPFPMLIVLGIVIMGILAFHEALFLQGLFPLFGEIIWGRTGVRWLAGSILIQLIILYGLVKLKKWAYWSALLYYGLLSLSAALSFNKYTVADLFAEMTLPAFETDFLSSLVFLDGINLALVTVPVLLVLLFILVFSGRYFK